MNNLRIATTHPLLQPLKKENPQLFTTAGLIALLSDYQMSLDFPDRINTHHSLRNAGYRFLLTGLGDVKDKTLLRRILADPQGWAIGAVEEVQQGSDFYGQIGGIFGTEATVNIFQYHSFRDRCREWQKELSISGVVERNISVRDRLFSYPEHYDQLDLLESDREVLRESAPRVVNFFFEVISIEPKYDLFLETDDDELISVDTLTTPKQILVAEIYSDSHEWEKASEGRWTGRTVQKLDPDKVKLHLQGEDDWLCYVAEHPDKSRFPWMH